MIGFVLRLIIVACGLALAEGLLPGVTIDDMITLIGTALLLGLVNAFIRPLLVIITLPVTVLTLGIFLLIINAAMVALVARLLDGFVIAGFWSALFTSFIVGFVSWVASAFIGDNGRFEVMVISRRH